MGRIEDAYGVSMTPVSCNFEPRGGQANGTQGQPGAEVPGGYIRCLSRGLVEVNSEAAGVDGLAIEGEESSFVNVLVGFDGRYASTD